MELKEKAILIKGKSYILVSDRVIFFNENYKNGCIQTKLITQPDSDKIIVKAKVIPDIEKPERYFNGYSQAVVGEGLVNKTAALENAETSAVGRALGMFGIGVIESIASADEMTKAGVVEKATGQFCSACKKEAVISPRTNKPYCPNWKIHKEKGEKYTLGIKKSKAEESFIDELDGQDNEGFEKSK